ncbi:MAG TPA: bifunctional 2',3'-cyclic-nucleotide 2'-phosphodiesterase/3'-nucleotidase [Azospirillaceae bacterium]|nr:bifunctional 2',3'-cyclic-nucleotide 2'-phosphodiesterase/3'-nucleotidase [Azospirillaceae bacterium]
MPKLHLTRRTLLTGAAASGLALGLNWEALAQQPGVVRLRLLETTDIHVHVFPYDYYRDREDDTMGLAKTATLIARARAEVPNSLLFDNGDFLQGNPMGDWVAYQRGMRAGDTHPVMNGMRVLGYDAATLGNHEFNYGLDFLDKVLSGANFPIVCANVAKGPLAGSPRGDQTLVKPYTILERTVVDEAGGRHPLKVGVIGVTPPQIMQWDRAHLEGNANARDIVEAAAAWVPEMRERGADIVVMLSHSGIAPGNRAGGDENASLFLAREVKGIDAIFTGHQHKVFPGPDFTGDGIDAKAGTLAGVPTVMAGFWGSHLGLIDLVLKRDGGRWHVLGHSSEARPIYKREGRTVVPQAEPDVQVMAAVKADHESTLAYVRQPVGKITAPINSYFALVADDPSVQIVSQAQLWYVGQLLKGTPHADLPVLSAAAPFKAGGRGGADYYTDVPAGDIAIKNVADLYLYPNTVRAVAVTGEQVKEWLERSAGIFRQINPSGEEQPLLDPNFPSFNYDVIDGVTYRIDLTKPSRYDLDGKLANPDAHRIVDLRYQGKPIDPKQRFVIATNNYRAGGGGKFPGADGTTIILEAPDTNRDVLVRYIAERGTIDPSADGNWGFVPVPGATNVVFDSAPQAQQYLSSAKGVAFVGPSQEGFAKYRLDLSA